MKQHGHFLFRKLHNIRKRQRAIKLAYGLLPAVPQHRAVVGVIGNLNAALLGVAHGGKRRCARGVAPSSATTVETICGSLSAPVIFVFPARFFFPFFPFFLPEFFSRAKPALGTAAVAAPADTAPAAPEGQPAPTEGAAEVKEEVQKKGVLIMNKSAEKQE